MLLMIDIYHLKVVVGTIAELIPLIVMIKSWQEKSLLLMKRKS